MSAVAPEWIVEEGRRLVAAAHERGMTLRLSGGAAVWLVVGDRAVMERLGREPMSDLDLAAPGRDRGGLRRLLDAEGYEVDENMLASGEGRRYAFWRREAPHLEVDLFIDRLEMCHTLDWRGRLPLPGPALPVTDLLLQKLQIADITRKDLADAAALLLAAEESQIELDYLTGLLGDDWGFHHSVELNLPRVVAHAMGAPLAAGDLERLRRRVAEIERAMAQAPKSRRWRRRAKAGESRRWYEPVEHEKTAF